MSRQTPLLIKPSLAEISLQAAKIGLPPREAEKFFHHYEMTGWKWGKSMPIKSWVSALQKWRLNWEERVGPQKAVRTIIQKDLDAMEREDRRRR